MIKVAFALVALVLACKLATSFDRGKTLSLANASNQLFYWYASLPNLPRATRNQLRGGLFKKETRVNEIEPNCNKGIT